MAGCGCGGGSGGAEQWVNVKADGVPTQAMTKDQALESARVNGGYIKRA